MGNFLGNFGVRGAICQKFENVTLRRFTAKHILISVCQWLPSFTVVLIGPFLFKTVASFLLSKVIVLILALGYPSRVYDAYLINKNAQ